MIRSDWKRINSFRRAVDETSCCYKHGITYATCSPGFFALKRYKFQHRSCILLPSDLSNYRIIRRELFQAILTTFEKIPACASIDNEYFRILEFHLESQVELIRAANDK